MTTQERPAPLLEEMLRGLAQARTAPAPAPAPEPEPGGGAAPEEAPLPEPEPMTEAELFSRFRNDMRVAGLQVYDVVEAMSGVAYEGPAVNVRDPQQAGRATHLVLATYALGPNLWRMYPVLSPLEL